MPHFTPEIEELSLEPTVEGDGRWEMEEGSNCPAPFGEEEGRWKRLAELG